MTLRGPKRYTLPGHGTFAWPPDSGSAEGKALKARQERAKNPLTCKEDGCKQVLSIYNPGSYCGIHEDFVGGWSRYENQGGSRTPEKGRTGKW